MCDVVPMHASHVILNRPWQYDRKITFDEVDSKYTFIHRHRKVTLAPLIPKQVHKNQLILQREFERENERRKSLAKAEINDPKNHKEDSVKLEKLGKKPNFLVKTKEVEQELSAKQSLLVLCRNELLLSTNELDPTLPSKVVFLLQVQQGMKVVNKSCVVLRYLEEFQSFHGIACSYNRLEKQNL